MKASASQTPAPQRDPLLRLVREAWADRCAENCHSLLNTAFLGQGCGVGVGKAARGALIYGSRGNCSPSGYRSSPFPLGSVSSLSGMQGCNALVFQQHGAIRLALGMAASGKGQLSETRLLTFSE